MLSGYPEKVTVYEVGPRDGLQNEQARVPTRAKVEYINRLSAAGLPFVEATSFVSPRAIPQLGEAAEVMSSIAPRRGTRYPVLVPNEKGMLRALESGVSDAAVFTAASESFTKANINATIEESLRNFEPVFALARGQGVQVRGYVSTAFGCPYEGAVPAEKVRAVSLLLLEMGAWQVSLGDTIGVATPLDVERVLSPLLKDVPADRIAVHLHDTRGTALANVLLALQMGIATVDSSSAGLGGCPYAPGASGNLATEDLVYMLHGMGIETGVDLDALSQASLYIASVLSKLPASKFLQAYASSHPLGQ